MNLVKSLVIALCIFSLGACNKASDDGLVFPNGDSNNKATYKYDFTEDINGRKCQAKVEFSSKAEYCAGLQNSELNNNCALNARKTIYLNDCGNDFKESNSSKKEESAANPGAQKPAQPTKPNPEPSSQPLPEIDPIGNIPVVQELRAQGIKVSIDQASINEDEYLRGRTGRNKNISLAQQLEILWGEVASIKNEIILRKTGITELNITSYTHYYADDKQLYLQYDLSEGQAKIYIPLFDKLNSLRQKLGIEFNGIEGYSGKIDSVPFEPLVEKIKLLENNFQDLLKLNQVIKKIGFDSYSNYYSVSQELVLVRTDAEKALKDYILLLLPLADVYNWVAKNNIKLDSDFDIEKKTSELHAVFKTLNNNIPNLDKIVEDKFIKEIRIHNYNSETKIWNGLNLLSVAVDLGSQTALDQVLKALALQVSLSKEIQKPIMNDREDLDDKYLSIVKILESTWPKIKLKSAKLKEISLAYKTEYYESLQRLSIGYESSIADTLKVIENIK